MVHMSAMCFFFLDEDVVSFVSEMNTYRNPVSHGTWQLDFGVYIYFFFMYKTIKK